MTRGWGALLLVLLIILAGWVNAAEPRAPGGSSAGPSELADALNRENEVLETLESRLQLMEMQISKIIDTRKRGTWTPGANLNEALAGAPSTITTKNLRLERTISGNVLVYSVSAKNASVLQVMEAIAKTSGRELHFHSDVSRKHLAGRIHLALNKIEMLELLEIVTGTQGLDLVVEGDTIVVGPIRTLSDRPIEARLRDLAVTAYYQALFRYPASPEAATAYLGIGRHHQTTGFHTAAIQTAQSVLQRYPDSPQVGPALLMIGDSQRALRHYDEARTSYYRYVDSFPAAKDLAAITLKIGDTFVQEDKYPQAIAVYEEVARDYPKTRESHKARLRLARCLLKEKRNDRAMAQLRFVESAAQQLPADSAEADELDFMLAECMTRLKRYASARFRLKKIIERSPSAAAAEQAYYRLGDVFLAGGNAVAAVEVYSGAAGRFPKGALRKTLSIRLCKAYLKMGLYGMVENRLSALSPADLTAPGMRPLLLALACYRFENRDYRQALTLLDSSRLAPGHPEAVPDILLLRARTHLAAGQLGKAARIATSVTRLAEDSRLRAEAFRIVGDCHRFKKDYRSAAIAYAGEIP